MGQSLEKSDGEAGHAALLCPKSLNANGVCPRRLLAIGELALMVAEENGSNCSWFQLSGGSGERLYYMSLSCCTGVTYTGLCSPAA